MRWTCVYELICVFLVDIRYFKKSFPILRQTNFKSFEDITFSFEIQ